MTTAPYATPEDLRSALLGAGLLVATRTDGVYHRSGDFEGVLQGVERYAAGQRTDDTAPRRWFPPVMAREDFLRTDYVRSFPDLVGSIDVFTGGDKEHKELLAELDRGLMPLAVNATSDPATIRYAIAAAAVTST